MIRLMNIFAIAVACLCVATAPVLAQTATKAKQDKTATTKAKTTKPKTAKQSTKQSKTETSTPTTTTPTTMTDTKDQYVITVNRGNQPLGTIVLKLWPDVAPLHCEFFKKHVADGFYNGTAFHRVIPDFMIQGGDPNSKSGARNTWGTGGDHANLVKAEFSKTKSHTRGVLSAARTNDPNSFSGQFFICVGNPTFLDGQYTAFGEVVSGMEVADVIVNSPRDHNDNPVEKIEMTIAPKK